MAKSRRALQLDNLTEGDLVEFCCLDNIVRRGIYRGVRREPWSKTWWSIRLELPNGDVSYFKSRAARSVRILTPVARMEVEDGSDGGKAERADGE